MKKEKISLQHYNTQDFFNEVLETWLEKLWSMGSDIIEHELFQYKIFKINDRHSCQVVCKTQALTYDMLANLYKDKTLPKNLAYDTSLLNNNSNYHLSCSRNIAVVDVIEAISQLDNNFANEVLNAYHDFVVQQGQEPDELEDHIWMNTHVMLPYLKNNNIVRRLLALDFDSDNRDSINTWFETTDKANSFRAFNDLDYTPFLIDNHYMIWDTSGARFYVYENLSENHGIWYKTTGDRVAHTSLSLEKSDVFDPWDIYHSSNQYFFDVLNTIKTPINLIAEFVDGKIVRGTPEIYILNLIQSFICSELESEDLIEYPISLDMMIQSHRYHHYRPLTQTEAFFEVLGDLSKNSHQATHLSFRDFTYLKPDKLEQLTDDTYLNEEDKINLNSHLSHFTEDFNNLKKANEAEKIEILSYMEQHIEPLSDIQAVSNQMQKVKNVLNFEKNKTFTF